MRIDPELGGCSIVLLGSFNPRIFSPEWLRRWKLVSDREADDSEINVIHADITNFRVGSYTLQIESNRFSADTSEAPWVTVSDFVIRTFQDVLPHTPLTRLGINRTVHFRVRSELVRNEIGRRLAPLQPWGEWGKRIEESSADFRGGFKTLVMQETRSDSDYTGHVQVTIQPSALEDLGRSGIYMSVNDDYLPKEPEEAEKSAQVLKVLANGFDDSVKRSEKIIDRIMALSEEV